jgi:hypothetical protein
MLVGRGHSINRAIYAPRDAHVGKPIDATSDAGAQIAAILKDGTYDDSKTPSQNLVHAIQNAGLVASVDTLTLSNIALTLPEGSDIPENIALLDCTVEYEPANELSEHEIVLDNGLVESVDVLSLATVALSLPEGSDIPEDVALLGCTAEYDPTSELRRHGIGDATEAAGKAAKSAP